jgi:hypothetical protein
MGDASRSRALRVLQLPLCFPIITPQLPPSDQNGLASECCTQGACRGLSLEKYRELDDMDLVVKLQTEMIAEKGYIEMEVTDDEDEGGGGRATYGRGRRRFRPGVCKKPSG